MKAIKIPQQSNKLTKRTNLELSMYVKSKLNTMADEYATSYDAMVLLTLHKYYGFGKRRLRKFWNNYQKMEDELLKWYEIIQPDTETGLMDIEWAGTRELKKIGVDAKLWREKKAEWSPDEDEVWKAYK